MSDHNNKKTNRRRAFRIYEPANLFYFPIQSGQEVPSTHVVIDDKDPLPSSSCQENDSLNVNISSSGISFTCRENYQPGDYLRLRILLLSRMTSILLCSRVVYCRPSNPYETHQYPYCIGTEFVNIKSEDQALLNDYIAQKRKRAWMVNAVISLLVAIVLFFPDVVFDLVSSLFDFLSDQFIELLFFINDLIEFSVDQLIEHTLHTDRHKTQLISFYSLLAVQLSVAYLLFRLLLPKCVTLYQKIKESLYRKKMSYLYFWAHQTVVYKAGIISAFLIFATVYVMFFI